MSKHSHASVITPMPEKLSGGNFETWSENVKIRCFLFDDAGLEIIEDSVILPDLEAVPKVVANVRKVYEPDPLAEDPTAEIVREHPWGDGDDKKRTDIILRNEKKMKDRHAAADALMFFLTDSLSSEVKSKVRVHEKWDAVNADKKPLEYFRLIREVVTTEAQRGKDGIMLKLKSLRQHQYPNKWFTFIDEFTILKTKLKTMDPTLTDAEFIFIMNGALNKSQFVGCDKVSKVVPFTTWENAKFPGFSYSEYLSDVQQWHAATEKDFRADGSVKLSAESEMQTIGASNTQGQVNRTFLTKQTNSHLKPNDKMSESTRLAQIFMTKQLETSSNNAAADIICQNCGEGHHKSKDCPTQRVPCLICNNVAMRALAGLAPRDSNAPPIDGHLIQFCRTVKILEAKTGDGKGQQQQSNKNRYGGDGNNHYGGNNNKKFQRRDQGRGGSGRDNSYRGGRGDGGRGRGRGRSAFHTTLTHGSSSDPYAKGLDVVQPAEEGEIIDYSAQRDKPDVCYTAVADWRRPIRDNDIALWMDGYYDQSPETRSWRICDNLPRLNEIPVEMQDIPRAYVAQFYAKCHNDPLHPVHTWPRPPPDDIIDDHFRLPQTCSADGKEKFVIELFHSCDVRAGLVDRLKTEYPTAACYMLDEHGRKISADALPLAQYNRITYMVKRATNQQPSVQSESVFVDSCAAINVSPSTQHVSGAVLNADPSLGIMAINGESLPATHTAYDAAIGSTIIVPGVQATLASVAELTKHGNSVTFHTDRTFTITTEKTGDTYSGVLNSDNIYEMKLAEYKRLQENKPRTPAPPIHHSVFGARTKSNAATRAAKQVGVQPASIYTVEQQNRAAQVLVLHNCLSHPSDKSLITAFNNGVILGTHLTAKDVLIARDIYGPCPSCLAGKKTKPSFTASLNAPADSVGHTVHVDIYILHEASIGGYIYYLYCVDEFSCYNIIIPIKTKSHDDLNIAFFELKAIFTVHKHTLQNITCDSESNLGACDTYLASIGIKLSQTPPYQHAQRLERHVQTVNNKARTILASLDYTLPTKLYGELLHAVITHINDLPTSNNPTLTPRIMVVGTKLDMQRRLLFPFGTVAMLHKAGKTQQKFMPRSEMGITLGPSDLTYGAVRAYLFESGLVVDRSELDQVAYFPTSFPWPVKKTSLQLSDVLIKAQEGVNRRLNHRTAELHSTPAPPQAINSTLHGSAVRRLASSMPTTWVVREPTPAPLPLVSVARSNPLGPSALSNSNPLGPSITVLNPHSSGNTGTVPRVQPVTASSERLSSDSHSAREGVIGAKRHANDTAVDNATKRARLQVDDAYSNISQTTSVSRSTDHVSHTTQVRTVEPPPIPTSIGANRTSGRSIPHSWKDGPARYATNRLNKTFRVTMNSTESSNRAQESREAMRDEILNMLTYKVGHYVNYRDIPFDERGNILRSFMFLKHKTKPDGTYDRTKARLVGNGANQKDHMYDLISSSTVALSSVMLMFNIASYYKCEMASYDVKGAFLNAEFGPKDVKTYIKINKDIAAIWAEMDPSALPFIDNRGELVLELDKFIYGLKQSPYKFQQCLREFLLKEGYEQLNNDDCLFIKRTSNPSLFSIISIHVDDILQVATSKELVTHLHKALVARFGTITFYPSAESYIGMTIKRSADRSRITLTQAGLTDKILAEYDSGNTKTTKDPHTEYLFHPDTQDSEQGDKTSFLKLIMSLMYLARLTRPDILLPVTFLASRSHCCTMADHREAVRICRYLRGTKHLGITIQCNSLDVRVWCDASYQVHADGKSHTGYIVTMGTTHSYVHSRSGKQKLTATSSTDAEVLALVESLKQATWIRNILIELNITPRRIITVYQDNKSVIIMTETDSKNKHSKHILSKITYARELHKLGIITVNYLNTQEMVADLLTKPLHGEPFKRHRSKLLNM